MNAELAALAARLAAAQRITPADVLTLRGQVYGAASLAADDLETLARLDAAGGERCPEWGDLFAEALADFVVRQEDPADYVDEAKAAWLMGVLGDRPLAADSGLEALARVLDEAAEVPPALDEFALGKVKAAMVAKRRVDAGDIALLGRVIFSAGGEENVGVSRPEADALFAVNDASRAAANDAGWPDFFAKTIADHLTAVTPFHAPSRAAVMQEDAWLEDRPSVSHFMAGMAAKPDIGGALHEILHPFADEEAEWGAADAQIDAAEAQAASITDEEARWLVSRLGQDRLSEAERRLIGLLKTQGVQVSGLLQPLLDAAAPAAQFVAPADPVAPSTPQFAAAAAPATPAPPFAAPVEPARSEPPVFGHRRAIPG